MLTDAGSIPAVSTNSIVGLDPSRPTIPSLKQPLSETTYSYQSVSDGLEGSPFRHRFDTNQTQVVFGAEASERAQRADNPKSTTDFIELCLKATSGLGTRECERFRRRIFESVPILSMKFAKEYAEISKQQSYVKANQRLRQRQSQSIINDLNLTWTRPELVLWGDDKSRICTGYKYKLSTEKAFDRCKKLAESYSLVIPDIKEDQKTNYLNRFSDKSWWVKKAKKLCNQRIDEIDRELGSISKKREPYCGNISVKRRQNQKEQDQKFLAEKILYNHKGQSFSLAELAATSVSNPAVRRAEFMTRVKGFEIVADSCEHACEFYTLTTPSKMHASLSKGFKNPKFDGTTQSQAHKYLNQMWARIRAEFGRQNINPYGFRIAEPHHDGTPHWHFLLFMPKNQVQTVRQIMEDYALSVDGDEKGAKEARFKAVSIDLDNGSAAGYVAKYVSKNIDGEHIEDDKIGNSGKDAAKRIEAWASTHSIRQFQQIGGPSVTIWRELRKLRQPVEDSTCEAARLAADAGNWAAFVFAMGGVHLKRTDRPIKPYYAQIKAIDIQTGEVVENNETKYGDEKKSSIRGVTSNGNVTLTRKFVWSTDRLLKPLDALETDTNVRGALHRMVSDVASGNPWTRVNNCTEVGVAQFN